MRRSSALPLAALGLSLTVAACDDSRPPPRHGGHHHGPHGAGHPGPHGPPSYAMPWMIPVPAVPAPAPTAAAPAAPPPASASAEQDRCLSEAGTAADCEAALRAIAAASPVEGPAVPGRVHDVYKKACEKKAKLLSCGVFRSTAISEADRPQVELLMLCEGGRAEACEDVSTKVAPLVAWHQTLKGEHCKQGHMALCKNPKQCKGPTQWGCRPADGVTPAQDVCGCVPRQCDGKLSATPTGRAWADGTRRGRFACAN